MSNADPIKRRQLLNVILTAAALGYINPIAAEGTSEDNTSSSCNPQNCKASCTPTCNADEACILRTMTECGTCPASNCVSRVVLGLPPLSTASVTNTPQHSSTISGPTVSTKESKASSATSTAASPNTSSNNTGALIGGIVGGLVGFGLILAICIFFYLRRSKKRGRFVSRKAGRPGGGGLLPFLNNSSHILASKEKFYHDQQQLQMQQEQQQQTTPHPAVLAALAHQHRSSYSTFNMKKHLVDSKTNNDNNNNATEKKMSTVMTGEALSRKVTLQNKRISEILNDNPRLRSSSVSEQQSQQHHQLHQPVVLTDNNDNRHSVVSSIISTDDESDFGEHQRQIAQRQSTTASLQFQKANNLTNNTAVQEAAVVTRAKPQIMRVNSVRSTTTTISAGGGGLSRSGSVRTILTPCDPPTVGLLTRSASARSAATNRSDKSLRSDKNHHLIGRSASVRSAATSYTASTLVNQPMVTASALGSEKPFTKKQLHRSTSVRSTSNEIVVLSKSKTTHRTSNDTLKHNDASTEPLHQNFAFDNSAGLNDKTKQQQPSDDPAAHNSNGDCIGSTSITAITDSQSLTTDDKSITIENPFQDTQTSFKTADEEFWTRES